MSTLAAVSTLRFPGGTFRRDRQHDWVCRKLRALEIRVRLKFTDQTTVPDQLTSSLITRAGNTPVNR